VAVQVAEQMADYLLDGAVTNALNMPSVSAEESVRLSPYMALAKQLGAFAGQLTEHALQSIQIEYQGDVTELNTRPLTAIVVEGLLQPLMDCVNMVNALAVAKERDIDIVETRHDSEGDYNTFIKVTVTTDKQVRCVAGTLFADKRPRIVSVKDIAVDAELTPNMLYVSNEDLPGFIGALGTTLGEAGLNIATFSLGRASEGGEAIALVAIDAPADAATVAAVESLPHVKQVKALTF